MLDNFKKFFNKKEEEPKEELPKKLGIPVEELKKKVLEQFNKLKPEVKEEKPQLAYSTEATNPYDYNLEQGETLKKFLHKPSLDKMDELKNEGKWCHLNKIFAHNYEQE